MAWNKNQSELVRYSIEYSGNFLFPGTVEFRYRANSKLINGLVRNGVFKFYIDGIDQNVASDYLLSGLWMTIERDVTPGFHQMKWVYSRYINLPNFSMEDLAAELEYVKIKGVSFATKECTVCNKGVPNLEQDRCLPCMRNQYLDDLSQVGGKCLDCPANMFSPPGSVGAASCKRGKPCTHEDYSVTFGQCDSDKNTRLKEHFWKVPQTCNSQDPQSVQLPKN